MLGVTCSDVESALPWAGNQVPGETRHSSQEALDLSGTCVSALSMAKTTVEHQGSLYQGFALSLARDVQRRRHVERKMGLQWPAVLVYTINKGKLSVESHVAKDRQRKAPV